MNPEWSLKGGLRGIRINVQQKGEDLLMECRGDIEMGVHGNGDVCQLQEAWDHSTVLLCTIIPLNPVLLLSLASHYPTQLTHCHTLVQLLCLLMTQACHSFSGYTVNTGAPVPRGLMDWSRLFTAVAFSTVTHKRHKEASVSGRAFPVLISRTHRHALYFVFPSKALLSPPPSHLHNPPDKLLSSLSRLVISAWQSPVYYVFNNRSSFTPSSVITQTLHLFLLSLSLSPFLFPKHT